MTFDPSGVALLALLVAGDYYTYHRFFTFARYRRWAKRYARPILLSAMVLVPLLLVVSSLTDSVLQTRFVEPVRTFAIGYYGAKLAIALVLGVADGLKFITWLFNWFRRELLHLAGASPVESDAAPEPDNPLVAVETSPALDLADMKELRRREFISRMGWSAATVPFVVVGYGFFRSLYDFEIHEVVVEIPGLPRQLDGLRIAQLSDLHAGSLFSPRPMEDAVDVVNSMRPDMVAVTGDFVNYHEAELPLLLPGLSRLTGPLGVYACLGNHDHYANAGAVAEGIRSTPLRLLMNEHERLSVDGADLFVIGVDNTGHGQNFADLTKAMKGIDVQDGRPSARILLAHDPTFWDTSVRTTTPDIDLTLSGHTHGGQVGIETNRLKLGWAKIAYDRWAGLYSEPSKNGSHHLYVNRGLGTIGPPMRLGIKPEITLLSLRAA